MNRELRNAQPGLEPIGPTPDFISAKDASQASFLYLVGLVRDTLSYDDPQNPNEAFVDLRKGLRVLGVMGELPDR